jgi:hypothetical protein
VPVRHTLTLVRWIIKRSVNIIQKLLRSIIENEGLSMFKLVFCCIAATLSTSAISQNIIETPSPPPVAPLSSAIAYLRAGTEVPLKLAEELTTKHKALRVGQRIRMVTSEAIVVQGATVIPVGSPSIGEITEVRNKGMWGKSGHFTGQIRYVTVNGRQIRLSGTFDEKGTAGGIGASAVSAIIFLPAGFFMTGTSAELPIGTPVKGFIDEDVPLALANAAQAPLVVDSLVAPLTANSPITGTAVGPAVKPD